MLFTVEPPLQPGKDFFYIHITKQYIFNIKMKLSIGVDILKTLHTEVREKL